MTAARELGVRDDSLQVRCPGVPCSPARPGNPDTRVSVRRVVQALVDLAPAPHADSAASSTGSAATAVAEAVALRTELAEERARVEALSARVAALELAALGATPDVADASVAVHNGSLPPAAGNAMAVAQRCRRNP